MRRYNGTDHNSIHYNIQKAEIEVPEHRNYRKADWNRFQAGLNKFTLTIPSDMTECKLYKMLNKVNIGIEKALDISSPIVKARTIDANIPWWTKELASMRNSMRNNESL